MKPLYFIVFLILLTSCSKQPKLIFEDNFDGNSLNENIWNFELGKKGWGNDETETYTKKNHEVKNGYLTITAKKENDSTYTSTRLTTKGKFEFTYGTIEMRAKLATGKGIWPAFWMLGSTIDSVGWPKCGEVDIMEYVGREPHTIYTSLHTQASHGNTINTKKTKIDTIENGFHTYKANWTPEKIEFSIDNNIVYTFNPKDKNENTWPFDKPFFILVNLAVGGNFGGHDVDNSIFPQKYVIDYIKVYNNQ
ncbi:family 16 glycosylhydrolase [Zhouia sp. PK063]|uniref:glycoside hydrolase family 16 protein n=1 Tax=Zhouia sp. PK063 TaxID=3373602 RepID=UPI00379B7041